MSLFKWTSILVLVLMPFLSQAQDFQSANPQYKAESSLVILRFVPKDKKAKIYLAGNKAATIDFNKDAQILSVVMMSDKTHETLSLNGNGTSYEVESTSPFPKSYEVLVKARVQGKIEELKLKIPTSKP